MNDETRVKNTYNKYGKNYQNLRDKKHKICNEYLEVPCMIKALGNIQGKKLLDVGCGAGIHLKKYISKKAICSGVDISETMIDFAKKKLPDVEFKVGSMTKLPYKNNSFDIVTISLSIHYIKDWTFAFKEINRVLKKDGVLYYSTESPIGIARENFENKNIYFRGIGQIIDKNTKEKLMVGDCFKQGKFKWEMLPGMIMQTYRKTFRTQLQELRSSGFELIDFIDCKPTSSFKKNDLHAYQIFSKLPMFSIFVAKKK
ncbi:MAG: class I SAM-dependent methyltransferase [Candidatus Woesearchaeota archaeon]